MDEESLIGLLCTAQLQYMPEKSHDLYKQLLNFEFDGKITFECDEFKKILSNAFMLGYNCGISKQNNNDPEIKE